MKRSAVWFFVALGLSFGFQDVWAQETEPVDLHPPYLAEEELAVPEGEEIPVLEEGEGDGVTERGFRRFKTPRTLKPRLKLKKGFKRSKSFRFKNPRPKPPPRPSLPGTPPSAPPSPRGSTKHSPLSRSV